MPPRTGWRGSRRSSPISRRSPAALTARWQDEKEKLAPRPEDQGAARRARIELEQAQRRGDLAKAGELAYGVIPELEKKLERSEAAEAKAAPWSQEAVTPDQIAQVVSRWTGIPVDKMLEGEREKLLQMEDRARQTRGRPGRGGGGGVAPRSAALAPGCRTRTGRSARSCSWARPASARPSSTKALAEFLFDDEHAMIRIDM